MYVIKYASIEPVWNFGSSTDGPPAYYHRDNYTRTFRTADLDRAFEKLDQMTAKRIHGARAEVRQVWRIEENGKYIEV